MVDVLEGGGGLNLTYEVRDGIVCHTGAKRADTLEGRIVAVADKIAYVNHDIDDSIRGGLLSENDIPKEFSDVLGNRHSARIDTMIKAAISGSEHDIVMEPDIYDAMMGLRQFLFDDNSIIAMDYIAGMSDPFAIARYEELFIPKFWVN